MGCARGAAAGGGGRLPADTIPRRGYPTFRPPRDAASRRRFTRISLGRTAAGGGHGWVTGCTRSMRLAEGPGLEVTGGAGGGLQV
ncbi:hypothetical protein HYH03_013012 [Edaphochlamys debaryana]|uniref:Uncharacterized protein n=1 Tax=Edaphochlamys debaryana TaxID=47281 RepID=A0A835XZK7_9CHLO|nr:hypothetical protein HYH03_013012 [Edaphochlamys debaryana]|eukprot:KAG2488509.1 hypothetical protein HYH03_013012 [Edaphochlamys debaryana]